MILQTRLGTDKFEVLPGNVIELYDCLDRPQAVSGALSAGGVALLGMAAFIVIRSRRQHKSER